MTAPAFDRSFGEKATEVKHALARGTATETPICDKSRALFLYAIPRKSYGSPRLGILRPDAAGTIE